MSGGTSIRELALRAVCTLLQGKGTPATGGVFRSRLDQIAQSELPCFDVTPGDEKIDDPGEFGSKGCVTHTLKVTVRGIVDAADQAGQDDVDDSSLDPFGVFAAQQLAGGSANLGGAVDNVTMQGTATVFKPGGKDLLGLEMSFEVQFAAKRGDPTQRG